MSDILFKIKSEVSEDKHRILEFFFKDWIDETCNREVQYKVSGLGAHTDFFRVIFERQEDAVIIKLQGIPFEFQNYLEIID